MFTTLYSGFVLWFAEKTSVAYNADRKRRPRGAPTIEALGVLVFAVVMGMSSLNILVESARRFLTSSAAEAPTLDLFSGMVAACTILLKLALWTLCACTVRRVGEAAEGASAVAAYLDDHRNDVATNRVAVVALAIASEYNTYWWLDPLGAAIIALIIVSAWIGTSVEQFGPYRTASPSLTHNP